MAEAELRNCPFCGAGALYVEGVGMDGVATYRVACRDCPGRNGGWFHGKLAARDHWNRRTALQASPAGRETDADARDHAAMQMIRSGRVAQVGLSLHPYGDFIAVHHDGDDEVRVRATDPATAILRDGGERVVENRPKPTQTDADVWAWGVRFPDRDDEVRLTEQHAHDATLDYEEGECEIIPLGALRGRETGTRIEGWQLIETAPPWIQVIVWRPDGGLRVGMTVAGISELGGRDANGRWVGTGGKTIHPSHWMPLPAPPASPEPASPPDGEVGGAS